MSIALQLFPLSFSSYVACLHGCIDVGDNFTHYLTIRRVRLEGRLQQCSIPKEIEYLINATEGFVRQMRLHN